VPSQVPRFLDRPVKGPLKIKSESQNRACEDFPLGSCSAPDMNNATSAADERHLGVRKDRQPFRLDLETEMATGIEPDSASDSKREARKVEVCTGNMGGSDAGQHERLSP